MIWDLVPLEEEEDQKPTFSPLSVESNDPSLHGIYCCNRHSRRWFPGLSICENYVAQWEAFFQLRPEWVLLALLHMLSLTISLIWLATIRGSFALSPYISPRHESQRISITNWQRAITISASSCLNISGQSTWQTGLHLHSSKSCQDWWHFFPGGATDRRESHKETTIGIIRANKSQRYLSPFSNLWQCQLQLGGGLIMQGAVILYLTQNFTSQNCSQRGVLNVSTDKKREQWKKNLHKQKHPIRQHEYVGRNLYCTETTRTMS